jgi:hypothetical protein
MGLDDALVVFGIGCACGIVDVFLGLESLWLMVACKYVL